MALRLARLMAVLFAVATRFPLLGVGRAVSLGKRNRPQRDTAQARFETLILVTAARSGRWPIGLLARPEIIVGWPMSQIIAQSALLPQVIRVPLKQGAAPTWPPRPKAIPPRSAQLWRARRHGPTLSGKTSHDEA